MRLLIRSTRSISFLRSTQQRAYSNEKKLNNHYETLKISPKAKKEDIRTAFLKLSRQMHPDISSKDGKMSHDEFIKINEAYRILSKDDLREKYDIKLGINRNPVKITQIKPTVEPSNEKKKFYSKDTMWFSSQHNKYKKKYEYHTEDELPGIGTLLMKGTFYALIISIIYDLIDLTRLKYRQYKYGSKK